MQRPLHTRASQQPHEYPRVFRVLCPRLLRTVPASVRVRFLGAEFRVHLFRSRRRFVDASCVFFRSAARQQFRTCDDGNIAAGDGCTAYCTWETIAAIQPRCGDGRIQTGEQCDDGNSRCGDGCSIACQAEFVLGVAAQLDPVLVAGGVICGDGVLVEPEECDDGNPEPGDGCSPLCNIEPAVCGNGVFEPGEQCDDGNTLDTDGRNAQCQTVAPPKPAAPLAQIIPMPILEPPPYMYL